MEVSRLEMGANCSSELLDMSVVEDLVVGMGTVACVVEVIAYTEPAALVHG